MRRNLSVIADGRKPDREVVLHAAFPFCFTAAGKACPSYNLSVTFGDTSPGRRGLGIAQTLSLRQRLPYQGSWRAVGETERLYYMLLYGFRGAGIASERSYRDKALKFTRILENKPSNRV